MDDSSPSLSSRERPPIPAADGSLDERTRRGNNVEGVDIAGADGSGAMFDLIAGRYDLLNRILSLGLDRRWRRRAIRAMALQDGARVLDVATGTADLALAVAGFRPTARVDGLDPSPRMLEIGREKVAEAGCSERIELREGTAEDLPWDEDTFDAVGIAFGIRNVPDRRRALAEMARVTRARGRVVVLELSEPSGILGVGARLYLHQIVPRIGALLSGSAQYRYLQESIEAFPPRSEFESLMVKSGLRVLESRPLTFGVCHLFVAEPLEGREEVRR